MRSKRRHKSLNHLKYQSSKKHLCPKCNKSVFFVKKKKEKKKKNNYRALCKNAKCLIHKKVKNRSRVLQKVALGGKCRIKEFEDSEKNEIKINPSMLSSIEGLMEKVSEEDTKYEKVLAQSFVKDAINKTVIWPLKKPKVFKGLRAAPKGVLLFGPSGVGKRIIGKHIAFQTKASFFHLSARELKTRWCGNKKDFFRALFTVARTRQPSVIFMEDVDIVFSRKAINENKSNSNLKNELLLWMDSNISNSDRILVIAATKKPFDLDDDIIVKFPKKFFLSLPDRAARRNLLEKLLECECHSLENCDLEELSCKTEGFTVEEIKQMSREAAMESVMSMPAEDYFNLELAAVKPISIDDFIMALRMIKPSVPKESLQAYESWDTEYGYGGQCARKMGHWNIITNNKFEESSYIT